MQTKTEFPKPLLSVCLLCFFGLGFPIFYVFASLEQGLEIKKIELSLLSVPILFALIYVVSYILEIKLYFNLRSEEKKKAIKQTKKAHLFLVKFNDQGKT